MVQSRISFAVKSLMATLRAANYYRYHKTIILQNKQMKNMRTREGFSGTKSSHKIILILF